MNKTIKLKSIAINNKPSDYIPSDELVQAVEVAYALKRPLLLSGEPGTGKTDFAKWVASTLSISNGFEPEPLIFNTKSTCIAQDLFYYYDAVSHFRAANIPKLHRNPGSPLGTPVNEFEGSVPVEINIEDFIELKPLGLAFQNAMNKELLIPGKNPGVTKKGTVVLIDEIDKAPRDFPNDLLNEIEKFEFEIKELNRKYSLTTEEKEHVLIIMTSNFEKNLPEAFLRRCVYFHISFPDEKSLKEIIKKRLNITEDSDLANLKNRISEFFRFREDDNIQKKPSTSECLDYIRVLHDEKKLEAALIDNNGKVVAGGLKYLSLLLKKKEDLELYTTI